MKKALFPVVALLVSTICASVVKAAPAPGRKLPGPSAVEAARLKKSPPPNYLSHYLPDDRYKIAGGVWKYVSTDLDTYYHVPSSPNMLRQPANRVIGFANARDAEEAGYVADPTDGTAAKAKTQTVPGFNSGGRFTSPDEVAYIKQMIVLVAKSTTLFDPISQKLDRLNVQPDSQQSNETVLAFVRPAAEQYSASWRDLTRQFNRMKPPARLRKVHTAVGMSFQKGSQAAQTLQKFVQTGDLAYSNRFFPLVDQASQYMKRARLEFEKVR